jgi:putative cardiolipin synthase
MLMEFRRLNRRMHNKSFIVDNQSRSSAAQHRRRLFDASEENNYRDLDLLAVGPVVKQASQAFDRYWNDEADDAGLGLAEAKTAPADLEKGAPGDRHQGAQVRRLRLRAGGAGGDARRPDRRIAPGQWFWGEAVLTADQPEKIEAPVEGDEPPRPS